jgi:nucleotide-binding universal stress UspA family protein
MKKILVFTDFSEYSSFAAKAAVEIAKKIGAEILFLHCTDVPTHWLKMTDANEALYQDVTEKVKKIHVHLNALIAISDKEGVVARHSIGYNRDTGHLADYLEENKIDFIVMGSRGADGFKEFFSGSNSQIVIRQSEVPVLVIKEPFDASRMRFVFVSAFEPDVLLPFKNLVKLAELIDAKIDLLYVHFNNNRVHTWEIEKVMPIYKSIAANRLGSSNIVDALTLEEGIDTYCQNLDDAVVCMATHGRKGLARFLMGSLAEQVVNHVDIPVLTLHVQ